MNKRKHTAALWIVLLLLALPRVSASEQSGSVSVRMTYDGQTVPGGSITLYQVAELDEDWRYVALTEFSGCGIDLASSLSPADAASLSQYAAENDISGLSQECDSNGFVRFSPLEPGLYLLVQPEAGRGYLPIRPFFVGIPQQISGALHYHVDASPKCAPLPDDPDPPNIPQTGQLRWPVPVMVSLGLFLLALGLLLWRKEQDA